MATPSDALVADIKAINRGRGIQEPLLRPGETLLHALRLDAHADAETARRTIMFEWRKAADMMPRDLGQVLLIAAAITYANPDITGRIEHAAQLLKVNPRTVWRRYGVAVTHLAKLLVRRDDAETSTEERGFYLVEFSQIADFTGPQPLFTARRRVRVVASQLTEFVDTIGLPRATTAEPDYRCLSGVSLTGITKPYDGTWAYHLAPTRPLRGGETWDYSVSVRMPTKESVDPVSVIVGTRHTTSAQLEVWLAPDDRAATIWALPGVPALALNDPTPREPLLIPDRAGRVRVTFGPLQPGHAYGIRWQWPIPLER